LTKPCGGGGLEGYAQSKKEGRKFLAAAWKPVPKVGKLLLVFEFQGYAQSLPGLTHDHPAAGRGNQERQRLPKGRHKYSKKKVVFSLYRPC